MKATTHRATDQGELDTELGPGFASLDLSPATEHIFSGRESAISTPFRSPRTWHGRHLTRAGPSIVLGRANLVRSAGISVQTGFGAVGIDDVGEQGDGGGRDVPQLGAGERSVALEGTLDRSGEQIRSLIQAVDRCDCLWQSPQTVETRLS
jgi:NADPH-dependent 2,4-dienoyl-CoA reductase/sulfur reductase-like enzyme